MTVKELIAVLSALPADATVTYTNSRFIVDGVDYDNYDNTITFIGDREFGIDYEDDIPDDVDETNYDPYAGCDLYEVDEMW